MLQLKVSIKVLILFRGIQFYIILHTDKTQIVQHGFHQHLKIDKTQRICKWAWRWSTRPKIVTLSKNKIKHCTLCLTVKIRFIIENMIHDVLNSYMFRYRTTIIRGFLRTKEYKVQHINPLRTKRRLLYLKTQFVPRSKHFSSRL